MAIKSILFLIGFVVACFGALYMPMMAIVGYILHYHIWPERQWWGMGLSDLGIRFSLSLAVFAALGTIVNFRQLQYRKFLVRHEWLLLLFLAVVWLSIPLGAQIESSNSDPPEIKLTKVLIFALIVTHVATSIKKLDALMWAILVGAFFLGWQAYFAGETHFASGGRLNTIGGPDFRESNSLAGHLAAILPIAAVQFMRSNRKGKLFCLMVGIVAINTIVLARSRGAFVGLAGGFLFALLIAPKGYRKPILLGMIAFAIGLYVLTDDGFWGRVETIKTEHHTTDGAVMSRLNIWRGSLNMLHDYPLGVGSGKFTTVIGKYAPQQQMLDAHNTYVLCYSELGVHGLAAYLLVIGSAFWSLRQSRWRCLQMPTPERDRIAWLTYGLQVTLMVFMLNGLTTSRIYAEAPWWILAMPVALERAIDNVMDSAATKTARVAQLSRKLTRTAAPAASV